MVAAIVAGDTDGVAAAYDRYAASLYAYCHSMLPGPAAAGAVLDTFMIAVSRLDGLGDPDRLGEWLHAVARNECLRALGAAAAGPGGPARPAGPGGPGGPARGSAEADDPLPAVTLPVGLRGQVLAACADNTPAGRATRMSVAHRAGPFGPAGFPKAAGRSGPRWWQRVRRHPRVTAAVAVAAALALVAGVTVITTAAGAHRPQAGALGAGGEVAGSASGAAPASASPGSTSPGSASPASSPAHRASPPASPPVPSVTMSQGAPSPGPPTGPAKPAPSPSPPPSPSPSPSPSPAQGYLLLAPDKLLLTSASGKPASGFFLLSAQNGPVSKYTIKVPAGVAGKVRVSPSSGSLPAGGFIQVIVTVTSPAALTTHVTVQPGDLVVTVVYKIKAS